MMLMMGQQDEDLSHSPLHGNADVLSIRRLLEREAEDELEQVAQEAMLVRTRQHPVDRLGQFVRGDALPPRGEGARAAEGRVM
jgi:hypothetical protein